MEKQKSKQGRKNIELSSHIVTVNMVQTFDVRIRDVLFTYEHVL